MTGTGPAGGDAVEAVAADLEATFDLIPLHRALGARLVETAGAVEVVGTLTADAARMDGMPTAHGGAVATLLDSAATFAILAATRRGWATTDLRVDYLRPVGLDSFRITTQVVRAGAKVGRVRADLHDGTGRICATAIGTFVPEGD